MGEIKNYTLPDTKSICVRFLCKRRLEIAAGGGRKPRHRGVYISHTVWDVNSISFQTV